MMSDSRTDDEENPKKESYLKIPCCKAHGLKIQGKGLKKAQAFVGSSGGIENFNSRKCLALSYNNI